MFSSSSLALVGTLAAILTSVLTYFVMWGSKNHFPVNGRTVVLTGASSGMGLAVCKELAKRGANIVLVAQNVQRLEAAVEAVRACALHPSQQRFLHLSYDLRSPESAPKILAEVTSWNNDSPPDVVMNCAGNAHPGFFHVVDLETHRSQMDTIYWSAAYLAHATLSMWTTTPPKSESQNKRKHLTRHLVFTSSCLAFFPVAGYGPYNPAKAAIKAMHDTLVQEVEVFNGANKKSGYRSADIKVHTVFPMGIKSPGLDNENKLKPALTKKLEESDIPQSAEEIARISIKGLEAGELMITPNFVGNMLRGYGAGGSVRATVSEVFYNLFAFWAFVLVIVPDILSKCRKWGEQNGMMLT